MNSAEVIRTRDANPTAFLSTVFSAGKESVGFKVFPEHVCRSASSRELFEQVLADPRVRKIVLRRDNRVETCVSCVRANATGSYIRKNLDHVHVRIEPHELQRFADAYDAWYDYLDERLVGQAGNVARVSYEELTASPKSAEAALRRVYAMLGVPSVAPAPGVRRDVPRQTLQPIHGRLQNYTALRDAFAGTNLAADFSCV